MITLDQNLHYTDWSPIKVNDWIKGAVNIIKSLVGWLGLAILLPILVVFLGVAYFVVRYLTNKLVGKINKDSAELIAIIRDSTTEDHVEKIRYAMTYQIYISKKVQEFRERRILRRGLPVKIMRPFFIQEDTILSNLNRVNDSLKFALYPNINKNHSQEELAKIYHRSEGVPDLDDQEMDLLMEQY